MLRTATIFRPTKLEDGPSSNGIARLGCIHLASLRCLLPLMAFVCTACGCGSGYWNSDMTPEQTSAIAGEHFHLGDSQDTVSATLKRLGVLHRALDTSAIPSELARQGTIGTPRIRAELAGRLPSLRFFNPSVWFYFDAESRLTEIWIQHEIERLEDGRSSVRQPRRLLPP